MRLFILCLFYSSSCLSQQVINAEDFFSIGLSQYQISEPTETKNVTFPWINKYEFRTETRDFDWGKQEYTIRISPSTSKVRNAQKNLYDELRNSPEIDQQEFYCDQVLTVHIDWLNLYVLNKIIQVMEEMTVVLNDKEVVYEKMAGRLEFDPDEFLKFQIEKSDLQISSEKIRNEYQSLLEKYGIADYRLAFENFTTVDLISNYLSATVFPAVAAQDYTDVETAHEQEMIRKEMQLESAEARQVVDFAQLKYNGPHEDMLQERLSLGVGFQLQNSGSRKLKMQKLKLEQDKLTRKAEIESLERQESLSSLERKLERDIRDFFHYEESMMDEREELEQLSRNLLLREGASSLLLLEIESRHLTMKLTYFEMMDDLLSDYLKYMHRSEIMCTPTEKNYLDQRIH